MEQQTDKQIFDDIMAQLKLMRKNQKLMKQMINKQLIKMEIATQIDIVKHREDVINKLRLND